MSLTKIELRRMVLALVVSLALSPAPRAQEAQLFAEDASGILELAGQSRLVIRDVPGTVSIRLGKEGELRYAAHPPGDRRGELPVALWLSGRTMILTAASGVTDPVVLEVAVSPEIAVNVEMAGGKLLVSGLQGALDVKAENTELDLRGLDEAVSVALTGGTLRLENTASETEIDGTDFEMRGTRLAGELTLIAVNSRLELTDIGARLDVDLEESSLVAATVQGVVHASASNSALDLRDSRRGAELRLDDTTLVLQQVRGNYRVDTDADLTFQDLDGSLELTGFGGAVRGVGASGGVRVNNSNAEVRLENIGGATHVEGDGLKIHMKQMKADVTVSATGSSLVVDGVEGTLEASNEFGDITIAKPTQDVKVTSRDGDVRVSEAGGAVELRADGARVDVGWSILGRDKDSYVENSRGDVWIRLPLRAACRFQANAPNGRIESNIEALQVSDDGTQVSAILGQSNRPSLQIKSGGNLYVSESAGQ